MTHECLWIRSITYDDDEAILLHTTHTGMDVPKWIDESIGVLANYYDWLANGSFDNVGDLDDRVNHLFKYDGTFIDKLYYPPCIAGGIIAARPYTLLPVPLNDGSQLADWSGFKNPLILTADEANGEWTLKRKRGGRPKVIKLRDEFTKRFASIVKVSV